jgi:Cu(I)/Ag(I) efflux system membrane fusion protein
MRLKKNKNGLALFVLLTFISCQTRQETKTVTQPHSHEHHASPTEGEAAPVMESALSTTQPTISYRGGVVSATGYIVPDLQHDIQVSSRVGGRITKLYFVYDNSFVRKGEPVMELYSPELNTWIEELEHLVTTNSDSALISKAKEKIHLLGFSDAEIRNMIESGKALYTVTLFSPITGYIFFDEKNSPENSAKIAPNISESEMEGTMKMGRRTQRVNTGGRIREGSYVDAGQLLYRLNNLEQVYAVLFLQENQIPIQEGDTVVAMSVDNIPVQGRKQINLVEPIYRDNKTFPSVLIHLKNNNGIYKVDAPVSAVIRAKDRERMMLPASSIITLGRKKAVWKLNPLLHRYEWVYVIAGNTETDSIEILNGISAGDKVALQAGYMTDRETILRK